MEWPIEPLPITELFLDQHNIRTPLSEQDQNALIRDMFANESAFELVKSIVQNGLFPDEFPIGIKENGKIIIIEGNRRLAALKALNEPDIVPSWQHKIRSIDPPKVTSIRVTIAPDRTSALKHIANKHTVDYRRPWKPLRQAYFYQSQLDNGKTIEEIIDEYPEHNVPRFIKMLQMHRLAKSIDINDSLKAKVYDERIFPITNLERFYNDKNVGEFLGIEFDDYGNLHGKIDSREFEKGYKKIVEDIAIGEIDSRKYNSIAERKEYLEALPPKYTPDKSRRGSFGVEDFQPQEPPQKSSEEKRKLSKRTPTGLFFQSDIPFNLPSTSLRLMYNELRDIPVEKFPNAAHDLLRSFLECTLVNYLKATKEYNSLQKSPQHNPKLGEMLSFITSDQCSSFTDSNLIQVVNQIKTNWSESYSLERMNMINHNEHWNSTEKDVRVAWAKIEGLIKFLLNPGK